MELTTRSSAIHLADRLGVKQTDAAQPNGKQREIKEKFQEVVAGTFYRQMLKALRETEREPAYFGGSQGEKIFRGQLDQHIADQLAKLHGEYFGEPLFDNFAHQIGIHIPSAKA